MILSNNKIKELLSKYFPYLNNKELDIFMSISKYRYVKNKETILKSGKYDKAMIFILKGVTRAFSIDESGNELNRFIRAEGHLMADANVFGDEVQTLTIEAIGEVHYLKFDVSKLEAIGYGNSEIMKFYHRLLKEIILTLSYRLNTFISMTPEERYLDLIKWNPILIETAFDKHIASFLGIKPLTIHRIKKKNKEID